MNSTAFNYLSKIFPAELVSLINLEVLREYKRELGEKIRISHRGLDKIIAFENTMYSYFTCRACGELCSETMREKSGYWRTECSCIDPELYYTQEQINTMVKIYSKKYRVFFQFKVSC
nr:hypothetical protein K-LCC10_0289 [Kaumoebavirus]